MRKLIDFKFNVKGYHLFHAYKQVLDEIGNLEELKDVKMKAFSYVGLGRKMAEFESVTKVNTNKAERIMKRHQSLAGCVDYIVMGKKGYYRLETKIQNLTRHRNGIFTVHTIEKGIGEAYKKLDSMGHYDSKKEAEEAAKKMQVSHPEWQFGVYAADGELTSFTYFQENYTKHKPNVLKKEGRLVLPAYEYYMFGSSEK